MNDLKNRRLTRSLGTGLGIFILALMQAAVTAEAADDLDSAIDKYRKGVLVIEAPPGTEVTVEQQRHEFWFGAALANSAFDEGMRPEDRDKYLSTFLTNFNAAVTENALKWHVMEPRRGNVNYRTVDASWHGRKSTRSRCVGTTFSGARPTACKTGSRNCPMSNFARL